MKSLIFLSAIILLGCGSSGSQNCILDNEAGAGGFPDDIGGTGGVTDGSGGSGGSSGSTTGGSSGSTTGGSGQAGSTDSGGASGENTGGTGNIGGNCQPWDEINIAIYLSGWTPESGEPIPDACGMVQDPCTGQWLDAGECGPFQECGTGNAVLVSENRVAYQDPIDNICGNSCVTLGRYESMSIECWSWGDYTYAIICTTEERNVTPPLPGCHNGTDPFTIWCCN